MWKCFFIIKFHPKPETQYTTISTLLLSFQSVFLIYVPQIHFPKPVRAIMLHLSVYYVYHHLSFFLNYICTFIHRLLQMVLLFDLSVFHSQPFPMNLAQLIILTCHVPACLEQSSINLFCKELENKCFRPRRAIRSLSQLLSSAVLR